MASGVLPLVIQMSVRRIGAGEHPILATRSGDDASENLFVAAGAVERAVLRPHMAKIRANNRTFWKECVRLRGLSEVTSVRLRGNFGTGNEIEQARLLTALAERGYAVMNIGRRESLTETLFETPARTWHLTSWNAWTDEMVLLGADVDLALFGGITEAVIDGDGHDAVAETKAVQWAGNSATWKQLRTRGITPGSFVAVDAHFWAIDEGSALRLQDRLTTDLGYTVIVDAPRRRLFRGSEPWSVTGTRPAQRSDEADINAWTDRMVELAHRTGTRFDGWGTWLSE